MDDFSKSVSKVQVLLPYIWLSLLITVVAFVVFNIFSKQQWKNKNIGHLDIFLGLSIKSAVILACSWIKFLLIVLFLCTFVKLQLLHYVFLLLPMLVISALGDGVKEILYGVLNVCVQMIGVLAANLIVNYFTDMNMHFGYYAVFAFFAILNFLYEGFTFIGELNIVSKARKLKLK